MGQLLFNQIPKNFITKWQEIADLLANILNVPAALIMKTENEFMEVFVSSRTENNPYNVGDKEHWHGLYCETVIKSQKELLIPNALKDKDWDKNPDIKLGMIAYLGLPINFPNNKPFGTLCVLNNKEHKFSHENEKVLEQFKNIIELDLALFQTLDLEKADNKSIIQSLFEQNDEYSTINEELRQSNEDLYAAVEGAEETKKLFYNIFNNLNSGVAIYEVIDKGKDFVFKYFNKAAERIDKQSKNELIGKSVFEVRPNVEHFGLINAFREVLRTKKPTLLPINTYRDEQIQGYYENFIFLLPSGELVAVFDDLTEQKKHEKDLEKAKERAEESEEKYRALYKNAPLSYQSLDADGNFIDINPMWTKTLGYERDEVIGKWYGDFLHPDYVQHFKKNFPAFKKRGYVSNVQFKLRKKDGTYIYVSFEGCVGYTPEGKFKQTYCVFKDITEEKALENALITAKNKAEKTARILHDKNQEYEALNEELNQTNEELYAAKEKAEESKENWQTTFNAIEDIVMLLSTEHDILEINQAGVNALCLPKEQIIGKKCFHLVHNKSKPILECPCKVSMKEKKTIKEEYKADNRTYELTAYPVSDEDGEISYFTHIVKDITEAKLKEAKISGLSNIIENSLNEIYIFDKNTLKFLFANKGALKNIGYKPDELKNLSPADLNPNFSEKQFQKLISPLLKQKSDIIRTETTQQRKTGSTYNAEITLQLAEYENNEVFVTFITDITERKKAAEEINRQKKLFETMFNTIQEGVVITNTKREIILANKGMFTTFGYMPQELIGEKTKMLYADEDKFKKSGKQVFDKNATPDNKNYLTYYKNKKGNIFPGETFGAKLYNDNGEWIGNIGIMRDITERQVFINELTEAKQKAEENSRLKNAFLNNLSHEIRTPLNAICGFSNMLDNPNIDSKKRKNFVSIINSSSDQLLAIVSDILTMSSLETNLEYAEPEAVNINELINEQFTIFNQQTKNRNISLGTKQELNHEQSVVYTDKSKLTQILNNLISNALKFTNEGFVEFGYEITEQESTAYMQFFVKDSGIGIQPKLHDRIFEHFVQADESIQQTYGGTGLGLSISKGFAELLGGKIWLESEPGIGSAFYFTIPYKPVYEPEETKPSSVIRKNTAKATILIAEDEVFNYIYLEELLSTGYYKLIHAKDGREAVEIFKANPEISLILMDIKMPLMDGHTAAKLIKEQNPDLPIIAQSAYALEHERIKYEKTFDDYLAKPISEDDLFKKVNKFL
jgi:PAS domain S-box-containing protein